MIKIVKKKKKTPWKSTSFFKRRKSTRRKVGHPVWVYKRRGRTYKYLTFTHNPEKGKESDYEKMLYNIDPNDKEDCYVKKKFDVSRYDAFEDPDKNYRIHEKDRARIKKHQK